ncbi:hypothetical protein ACFU5B_06520 [Streptomyces murinus]|uniref:hypothetical protein n=1 Tax=Streptomyces murinus TaxID=33900 RepID=UPI00363FB701
MRLPVSLTLPPFHAGEGGPVNGWTPDSTVVSNVEVTAASVQRKNILQLGGQPCRMADLFQLPQGTKQIVFESGELLTVHARTRLAAVRVLRRR